MTPYIALIHKASDSGYGVSFPDVPGFTAVADTLDEALHEGAIALAFAFAFEDWTGELPSRRTLDQLREDQAFRDWSHDSVVAAVAPAQSPANAA